MEQLIVTKAADDVFDFKSFWTDVEKYLIRRNMSKTDFSHILWVDRSQLVNRMNNRKSASLRWVVLASKYCDLDMNKYVR